MRTSKGNIFIWILIILAILVIAAVLWQYKSPSQTPSATEPLSGSDTTAGIQKDISDVDLGADLEKNLDSELDKDINSL